jgi:membrane-bound metal-dependent hydrolase YbcI (DUF457 family)
MQSWKTHLIFGLLLTIAWLSAIYFFSFYSLTFETVFILVVLIMFATLFPDIDFCNSKIRGVVSLIVSAFLSAIYIFLYSQTWYFGLAYFLALYFLLKRIPSKHRGFTHTLKFATVFSLIIVLVMHFAFSLSQGDFIFWFAVTFSAYALHLLLDKL